MGRPGLNPVKSGPESGHPARSWTGVDGIDESDGIALLRKMDKSDKVTFWPDSVFLRTPTQAKVSLYFSDKSDQKYQNRHNRHFAQNSKNRQNRLLRRLRARSWTAFNGGELVAGFRGPERQKVTESPESPKCALCHLLHFLDFAREGESTLFLGSTGLFYGCSGPIPAFVSSRARV